MSAGMKMTSQDKMDVSEVLTAFIIRVVYFYKRLHGAISLRAVIFIFSFVKL
jgi:hypothetical protein